MHIIHAAALTVVLALSTPSMASAQTSACADSIPELRKLAGRLSFPLKWRELSMSDGKPLIVAISERDGALFLELRKTGEGLWAHGRASICGGDGKFEAIPSAGFRLGPAAHWILRSAWSASSVFKMTQTRPGHLTLATPGWSGEFSAIED